MHRVHGRRLGLVVSLIGCADPSEPTASPMPASARAAGDSTPTTEAPAPPPEVDTAAPEADTHRSMTVRVTLDGEPIEGATVTQPGANQRWTTDSRGYATASLDLRVDPLGLVAGHPEARTQGLEYRSEPDWRGGLDIALTRFDPSDNPDYIFQDPGTPERSSSTAYCSHCHVTFVADWVGSAHGLSAQNPVLHDLYAGTAAAFSTSTDCANAGGTWRTGLGPGTAAAAERCYLGEGALPAYNTDCGDTTPCDAVATETGDCASCHAPGIDGALADRGLLEATGIAYDHGVHCDVCHKIADVDPTDPQPGVGGRIQIVRPSEESTSMALGDWWPLTFGPYGDVANPRMGAVHSELFATADLCAGCHEHYQEAVVPGTSVDTSRWPTGRIPVQTTWAELRDGPLGLDVPCQSCHMPPDPDVGNAADLGNVLDTDPGLAAGWYREAGSVRRHAWFGPRSDEQRMLDLAATLTLSSTVEDGVLTVDLTAKNSGPGHAIPTGEPMRQIVALVEAKCGGTTLEATGGDAVPDFGGALDRQDATGDWNVWPGASVGQQIRVIERTGAWHDPPGTGPFGDGTFTAEQKGMPVEVVVGTVTITAVAPDGTITTDTPIPDGDIAYRVDASSGLRTEGAPATTLAGAPGFAFARVMVDADGNRNVPHFLAVDVASDNRLPPQQSWTSHHTFATPCADPTVQAQLVYRSYPVLLARERGWDNPEQVMAEASR
jgi:hypothetical protein